MVAARRQVGIWTEMAVVEADVQVLCLRTVRICTVGTVPGSLPKVWSILAGTGHLALRRSVAARQEVRAGVVGEGELGGVEAGREREGAPGTEPAGDPPDPSARPATSP